MNLLKICLRYRLDVNGFHRFDASLSLSCIKAIHFLNSLIIHVVA